MTAGITRQGLSAFSSPILLAKKKDGRFCVDFRALNQIIIENKFPIPTVDEVVHELYDSRCFSKLNLDLGTTRSEWMRKIYTKQLFKPMRSL